MSTIGENIKSYRKKKGLTQNQLQSLSGIDRAMIARYETNKATPTIETLRKIADGLEIPFSYLLGSDWYDNWNNQTNMTIGKKIKRYREERGILPSELAEKCDISESLLNQFENDIAIPSLDIIKKIADIYKSNYTCLLPDDWGDIKNGIYNNSIDKSIYLSKQEVDRFNELTEKHLLAGPEISDYLNIVDNAAYAYVMQREYSNILSNSNPLLTKLIELFNQLNEDGQKKALEQVNLIVKIEDYQIKK